jgi:hypothetical protein
MTLLSPRAVRVQRSPSRAVQIVPTHATVGLGDPVTDLIVELTHEELSGLAGEAGGCVTIDGATLERLLSKLKAMGKATTTLPGGSAANVMRCMAQLSSQGTFTCVTACPCWLPALDILHIASAEPNLGTAGLNTPSPECHSQGGLCQKSLIR